MPDLPDYPESLLSRINLATSKPPVSTNSQLKKLLEDVRAFISASTSPQLQSNGQQQPSLSKKRKLEDVNDQSPTLDQADTIADVSFSIPQRKKLKLSLGRNPEQGSIKACNPSTNETEFGITWRNIEHCVCVPVPEKAQPQWNFCIFPKEGGGGDEQILFTIPGGNVKGDTIHSDTQFSPDESYKDVVMRMMNQRLKRKISEPNEKEFVSQVAQAYRKGEKAVHAKAFRGSKDGYLFFLSSGIVWGFKKPLAFFPFHAITSISYTSVLQRTFNLNITTTTTSSSSSKPPPSPNPTDAVVVVVVEIEFSMIDQADFAGIDAYVRRHQLQDASMAEQRRAKKLNVNGVKGAAAAADDDDDDGAAGGDDEEEEEEEGELQKAAREIQDAEDEEEEEDDENFDPGSEGESEGSGSSSGEEEGGDDDDDDDGKGRGGGLAEEELGSEMEEDSES
ncbi:MAG: hypothetical protein L6R35_004183 [Caloplaca aegaea]|nr:MAG: hypothetical protein L6R35_004183 [Caloplaca aegaea]